MKRIPFLVMALALSAALAVRAQDAATEERLNRLSGRVEDISAAQEEIKKQLAGLMKEVETLREQMSKPSVSYARPEDLTRLADAIKEVDRKRIDDAEMTHAELLKLRKLLETPVPSSKKGSSFAPARETSTAPASRTSDTGFEYVIKSGDTLDAIVQAYREKNIKVSVKDILNANPGLKAERLRIGQKIFIPAPQ